MTAPAFTPGDRIRKAIRESGHTQTALAHKMGVSISALNHWVNGRNECPRGHLVGIAYHCNVPVSWLKGGDQ